MSFEELWKPKTDGVDDVVADDINAIAEELIRLARNGSSVSIKVDSEMSDTSENAVQNKVIKEYVDGGFISKPIIEDIEDVNEAYPEIRFNHISAYGIVSTLLNATLEEDYQHIGFTSALYFATPSVIPENYSQFPADIYFKGDSTDNGAFVPEANMRYTIVFDFDGFMMNGYVSGVTTV